MPERMPAIEWDFSRETACMNCKKDAIQHIDVRPEETVIICMNCGAARHYTPRGLFISQTFDEDVSGKR